jgi:hypothetical protein
VAIGWAHIAGIEDAATAGSSAINAAMLLERALRGRGPRRTAASLLSSLFVAIGLSATSHLVVADPGAAEVLLRGPLLTACLAVTAVLALGARR